MNITCINENLDFKHVYVSMNWNGHSERAIWRDSKLEYEHTFKKAIPFWEIHSRKLSTTSKQRAISRILVTSSFVIAKFTVNWISKFWM